MKQQMTSKQSQELREELHGILRGEIKTPSTKLQLASEEEWKELGLNEPRVYTSLSLPGGNSASRSKRSSEPEKPSQKPERKPAK